MICQNLVYLLKDPKTTGLLSLYCKSGWKLRKTSFCEDSKQCYIISNNLFWWNLKLCLKVSQLARSFRNFSLFKLIYFLNLISKFNNISVKLKSFYRQLFRILRKNFHFCIFGTKKQKFLDERLRCQAAMDHRLWTRRVEQLKILGKIKTHLLVPGACISKK